MIPEYVQKWVESIKAYKEKRFAEAKNDHGDARPLVIAERDGQIVASISPPDVDRDMALKGAFMLRAGTRADRITVVFDAHSTNMDPGTTKEQYTKEWPQGEMQRVAREERGCERGVVKECMMCVSIDLNKQADFVRVPYSSRSIGGEHKIQWDDEGIDWLRGHTITGHVVSVLQKVMDTPWIGTNPLAAAVGSGLTEDQKLYHAAKGAFMYLEAAGFEVTSLLKDIYNDA